MSREGLLKLMVVILCCVFLIDGIYITYRKYQEIVRLKKKIALQETRLQRLKDIYNHLLIQANLIGNWNRLWSEVEECHLTPKFTEVYSFNISSDVDWKQLAYILIVLEQYQKNGRDTFFVPGDFSVSPSGNNSTTPGFTVRFSGRFLKLLQPQQDTGNF